MTFSELPAELSSEGNQPKYRRIAAALEEYLRRTQPPSGTKFFNDRLLAEHFATTPMTMARSLNYLVSRGLLERRVGAGTFVNAIAGPAGGKRRIGIVCHEDIRPEEVYVTPVLSRFNSFWDERHYTVVSFRGNPADYRQLIDEYELSGLMVFVPREEFSSKIRELRAENFPVVSIGHTLRGLDDVSFGTDHEAATKAAVAYLYNIGHRKIGFMTTNLNQASSGVYRRGYQQAMWERNLPIHPDWEFTVGEGDDPANRLVEKQLDQLLATRAMPSAILICNVFNALFLYQYAQRKNLRIPDDLSLIGFDDAEFLKHLSPPLTVMAQELNKFTEHAAEELLYMIEHGRTSGLHYQTQPILLERNSCIKITH